MFVARRGLCDHVASDHGFCQMPDPRTPIPRSHQHGDFAREETRLAHRNHGLLLELLRHDVTPAGAHYLLTHFDIPWVPDAAAWRLELGGLIEQPGSLSLDVLQARPSVDELVTLECAGNGRALIEPRWQSQPWHEEAVGTARWGGTLLAPLLEERGIRDGVANVVFEGADRGIDGAVEHAFARSLTLDQIRDSGAMLAWSMNGMPLLPQHGFPLRLIVPGWFGMASVKWLSRITLIDTAFDGYQQTRTYVYRQAPDDEGVPVQGLNVRALMAPPGIPDWYSRERVADPGVQRVFGRAWSGHGVPVERVEVCVGGQWHDATLEPTLGRYAWRAWHWDWPATPGHHTLMCRATDATGRIQPLEPVWDTAGFGNNGCQRVSVWVRDAAAAT